MVIKRFRRASLWVKCLKENSNGNFESALDALSKIDINNVSEQRLIRYRLMKGFLSNCLGQLDAASFDLEYVLNKAKSVSAYSVDEKKYLRGYAAYCLEGFVDKVSTNFSEKELKEIIEESKSTNLSLINKRTLRAFPLRFHPKWSLIR